MNKKVFLLVAIILPVFLYAKTEDSRIIEIRDQYKAIESELKSYKVIEKKFEMSAPGEGVIKYYYKNKELVKIRTEFHGDGMSSILSLYYTEGSLFFVFEEMETFPIWEGMEDSTGKTENRCYFYKNKMIRWISKSFEDKMATHYREKGTKEFIAKETQMLKESENWRAYEGSKVKNFDEFSDKLQDR